MIVETERGEALGWTVGEPEQREPHAEGPVRRILRLVNSADESKRKSLQKRELEALRFCAQSARKRNLPMKVIAVEWAHSGEKAAFYFSSEDRIDFRELVRELAQHFRIRVEMRQVGPRDEAKIIGAMGPCGRETCCSSWMRAFTPVSIKMAKDQGLSITPAKVTGVCGRLLCCLAYEQDTYKELRRKLPRMGKQVITPQGPGRVIDVLVLREAVRVFLDSGGPPVEFAAADTRPVGTAAPVIEESESDTDSGDTLDVLPVSPVAAPIAKPVPAAPPRIGRDRRDQRGPPRPATASPVSALSAPPPSPQAVPAGAPPPPRDQRPPQQSRDQRPPRPNRDQRPPRPEGQRPPRPEGQRPPSPDGQRPPQQNRDQRPPRPEGQQRPPRPNRDQRPPRPTQPQGEQSASPTSTPPAAGTTEAGPRREGGQRHHQRNRRRGGGGGGQGAPPSGGGAPPAGPGPA